jgi:hypothetical protein
VIEGRFPQGEAAIAKHPVWAKEYQQFRKRLSQNETK